MKKNLSIFCVMLISINVFAQNLPKLNLGGAKKTDSAISNDSSLNRGGNLTLAVRTPEGKNLNTSNQWILQYLQDSLTGKMAKYSKIKIVDRTNEKMIIAEQKIAESAMTDDENTIELGKITNAKLVVVGTVQQLSTGFEINLRINDVETNEIKSSYSNRVTLSDIENGEVVNACILEFFNSLGVELSESETKTLKVTNKKENNAVKALAKGDSAQKNGNVIEAMSYFVDAQKSESTKNLASKGITKIFNGKLATNDLKSQIEW